MTNGVLVGTSQFCTTTTTVIVADDHQHCLVVDPAVTPADVAALVADLDDLGLTVAAGFATHPHWDHVVWAHELGTVPRYATAAAVGHAETQRERIATLVEQFAPGHDLDLLARLTAVPVGTDVLPWPGRPVEIIAHPAHVTGHAALLVADVGVLVAGDMLSDVETPLPDLDAADPIDDYRRALDTFAALDDVRWVVPGHGRVGDAGEFRRRIDADRRYLDAVEAGHGDDDARLTEGWLRRDHEKLRRLIARP